MKGVFVFLEMIELEGRAGFWFFPFMDTFCCAGNKTKAFFVLFLNQACLLLNNILSCHLYTPHLFVLCLILCKGNFKNIALMYPECFVLI